MPSKYGNHPNDQEEEPEEEEVDDDEGTSYWTWLSLAFAGFVILFGIGVAIYFGITMKPPPRPPPTTMKPKSTTIPPPPPPPPGFRPAGNESCLPTKIQWLGDFNLSRVYQEDDAPRWKLSLFSGGASFAGMQRICSRFNTNGRSTDNDVLKSEYPTLEEDKEIDKIVGKHIDAIFGNFSKPYLWTGYLYTKKVDGSWSEPFFWEEMTEFFCEPAYLEEDLEEIKRDGRYPYIAIMKNYNGYNTGCWSLLKRRSLRDNLNSTVEDEPGRYPFVCKSRVIEDPPGHFALPGKLGQNHVFITDGKIPNTLIRSVSKKSTERPGIEYVFYTMKVTLQEAIDECIKSAGGGLATLNNQVVAVKELLGFVGQTRSIREPTMKGKRDDVLWTDMYYNLTTIVDDACKDFHFKINSTNQLVGSASDRAKWSGVNVDFFAEPNSQRIDDYVKPKCKRSQEIAKRKCFDDFRFIPITLHVQTDFTFDTTDNKKNVFLYSKMDNFENEKGYESDFGRFDFTDGDERAFYLMCERTTKS